MKKRIAHALQSAEYRKLLPYHASSYKLTLLSYVLVLGYRPRADLRGGSWIAQVFDGDRRSRESVCGLTEDAPRDPDRRNLTFEEAVEEAVKVAAELGVVVDPKDIKPPPDAETAIRLQKAALGLDAPPLPTAAPPAAPPLATEAVPANGNGADQEAAPPAPASPAANGRKPLSENRRALAGLSNIIRATRAVHEGLSADDPLAVEIGILHLEKSRDLLRASLDEFK